MQTKKMNKVRVFLVGWAALMLLVGVACSGKKAGESCSWKGSGFTAKHDCALGLFCLSSFTCPGGKNVTYGRCVGVKCSSSNPCGAGKLCIKYSDSASYCMDGSLCPDAPTDD